MKIKSDTRAIIIFLSLIVFFVTLNLIALYVKYVYLKDFNIL